MDNIANKMEAFNKRWGIIEASSYEEELSKFKARILNIFSGVDDSITEAGISTFCQILGIKEKWNTSGTYDEIRWSTNIIDSIKRETDERKLYYLLQAIFHLPFQSEDTKENYYHRFVEAVSLSKIKLSVTSKNGEVILYPRGEDRLDTKLVNEVLSFLNEGSGRHFADALRSFEKLTPVDSIKSAESLRRSLEEFLRFKLSNQKGFTANIQELTVRLKAEKRDSFVRNIIFQTFSNLDQYFNENSKHKDGDIDANENEFLVYQVGLLMRYLDKVLL